LSAAMRLAGRLAGRPLSPCFTLVSRTFHARSLLATIQMRFIGEPPNSIWQFTGARPHPTWCNCQLTVDVIRKAEPKVHANNTLSSQPVSACHIRPYECVVPLSTVKHLATTSLTSSSNVL
jgi:hypothetical protein